MRVQQQVEVPLLREREEGGTFHTTLVAVLRKGSLEDNPQNNRRLRHGQEGDGRCRPEDSLLEAPRSPDCSLQEQRHMQTRCSRLVGHCIRQEAGKNRRRRMREGAATSSLRDSRRAGPLLRNLSVEIIRKMRWVERYRKSRFL